MALRLPDAFRLTRANTWLTRAGNGALLRIYTGAQPADADAAATGILLAQLTCGSPFGTASAEGVVTANAITQDSAADASGTAGWFRLLAADGITTVCDGAITATGGGGELQLVTTTVTVGQPVQVTSFTITEGGA